MDTTQIKSIMADTNMTEYDSDNDNKNTHHREHNYHRYHDNDRDRDRDDDYKPINSQNYKDNNPFYGSNFGGGKNLYSSVLPRGIPRSQIPAGHEDLYILKSEVIPPVCPVCPSAIASTREKPCPPCPPCARCPEPSFECKKVPNYNSMSSEYLPQPVLSSFSSFGM